MMHPEDTRLWSRVEGALDARRDPFEDRALSADLEASPRTEAAARRLVAALGHLPALADGPIDLTPAAAPSDTAPTSFWIPLLAAAAAVALSVGAWRGAAHAPGDAPFEGLVVYEARVAVERVETPPPRAARVVYEPSRVVSTVVGGPPR